MIKVSNSLANWNLFNCISNCRKCHRKKMSPEIREASLLLSIIGQLTSTLGQVLYILVLTLSMLPASPGGQSQYLGRWEKDQFFVSHTSLKNATFHFLGLNHWPWFYDPQNGHCLYQIFSNPSQCFMFTFLQIALWYILGHLWFLVNECLRHSVVW